MTYHDDWLVNVLLSDGRVYSFITEMWPEHGTGSDADWPQVVARAKRDALWFADRGAETWGLDAIPETEAQFRKAMDFVCMHTSDEDFRRYTR
jgi:hypothetical protein